MQPYSSAASNNAFSPVGYTPQQQAAKKPVTKNLDDLQAQQYRSNMRSMGLITEPEQNRLAAADPFMQQDLENLQSTFQQYDAQVKQYGQNHHGRWLDLVPWTSMS